MRTTPHDNYRFRAVTGAEIGSWQSFWLTTKRFRPLPYRPMFAHHGNKNDNTPDQNIHTLFRKNFVAKNTEIKAARIFITGDDVYKLYLNGVLVGEGPAQSYPFAYNYNCYDVTDLLKSGEVNAIGVHVYYQGLLNLYLISADNSHGMIMELHITYADGSAERIISDSSWKCKESKARTAGHVLGYETQVSENIDLNLWEDGWYNADYDISAWDDVCLDGYPAPIQYRFVPQLTPPVEHKIVYPEKIDRVDNGFFLDFGKECVGTVALKVKGNKGDVIEVRCGEELLDDGRVRYDMRCNCCYQEFVTLTGGEDFVDFFDFKGYRYVEIFGIEALEKEDVWTLNRCYPFPEHPAKFSSSQPLLEQIWEICRRGVEIGTQDTYYDCPTREKGGFVGDALITGLSHLILTGDIRVFKKFIADMANSARHFCAVLPHVPTYSTGLQADYSFLYPIFLEEYYNYTGDMDFVKEVLPVAGGILEYFGGFENEDSLLENITHIKHLPSDYYDAILIDWPGDLRDGYEFKKAKFGISTTVNGYYYGFLKSCGKLYKLVGNQEKADFYNKKAELVGESLNSKCYNPETGLYLDTTDSEHSALHASVIQAYFGLTPPKGYAPIVAQLKEKRLNCGVYFAYFVIGFLYKIGEYELAYDLITGKDEHSWYNMIKEGATSCMEVWGKDQKFNTSWCHPWSSSPIIFFTREIMGINITKPGIKEITVSPKIPDCLDGQSIDFPVPNGRIRATFEKKGAEIEYTISAPDDIIVSFEDIKGINFCRI